MKAKPDTDSGLSMRKLPGCVPSRKGAHSARPCADAELNCRGRRLLGQGRFVHGIDHLTPTDNEGQTKYKTKSRSGTDYGDGRIISRRRGGLGVYTPIFGDFLPRATIFLVLTASNSVLPELVVLISTTNSGGTALNAADRILTRKVVARGSKIGVSVPGLFWRDMSKRCKCGTKERQKRWENS